MPAEPAIISFSGPDGAGYGLLRADGVVDLSRRCGAEWPGLRALIQDGAMARVADRFAEAAPDLAVPDILYLPPIPEGARILCVGVNYPDRAQEYAGEVSADVPLYPSLFPRFPESFVGHDAALIRPTVSRQLDYEGEIVLVLGKGGRHIAERDALDCIAALTLCNEGSVRDWMRHGKFNVTQGKNFDRSGALGPALVPYRRQDQIADIRLTTRVNGNIRQEDRTSRMLFGFRRIIAYISTFMTLKPGDVLITGTPSGAGARQSPPIWLEPGDIVEIEAEGIGLLRNSIADEQALAEPS